MSMHGAGFNPALAAMLDRQAKVAGETVECYLQRSAAARMVADMSRLADPQLDELQRQLADAGIDIPEGLSASGSADAILTDPGRLQAVAQTGLLDSPPDDAFDHIVGLATEALGVPSSALVLMDRDRVFFLSAVGINADLAAARQSPLRSSISKFALTASRTLSISNATTDPRFKDLPFVANSTVVSYLGIPLINPDGYPVGSLAVWDTEPRMWTTGHRETLHSLARLAWLRIFEPPAHLTPSPAPT